jgi:hypothetical protein
MQESQAGEPSGGGQSVMCEKCEQAWDKHLKAKQSAWAEYLKDKRLALLDYLRVEWQAWDDYVKAKRANHPEEERAAA